MKRVKASSILLVMFLAAMGLRASGDVRVHFNFYQGIRQKDKALPTVATSYYLRPIPGKRLDIKSEPTKERSKLKRIYNLKEVKQLLQVTWLWKLGETGEKFREIVLNDHEYRVLLALVKDKSGFRLEVTERLKRKSKSLLDTEMILPLDNTAIFGFEDSEGKIYFLSFYKAKDRGKSDEEKYVGPVPKPTKRVNPVYPPEAVAKLIEGTVVMEVEIDKQGNVAAVKVTEGKYPLLNDAAVKAVRQWKYRPYTENGTAKTVKFSVVLDFYFN